MKTRKARIETNERRIVVAEYGDHDHSNKVSNVAAAVALRVFRPNRTIDRSDRFGLLFWARRRPAEFHHRDFASSRVLKRLNIR